MRPPRGPLPMGFPPPLALAKSSFASDVLFLSLFTAFAGALVALFAWLLARRRHPRLSRAVVVLALAFAFASFVPTPRAWTEREVEGLLTGTASFEVASGAVFQPAMRGGEARVERTAEGVRVELTCPERCEFLLGDVGFPRDALEVRLEGGPFLLRVKDLECQRLPATLWLVLGGRNGCEACAQTEFLTAKGEGGAQRVAGATRKTC